MIGTDAASAWASSGAMWLTGRADGPPRTAPGHPALLAHRELARLAEATSARTGLLPVLPGLTVLGERAAVAGLSRQGPRSCGGSFRALPTSDGWISLSLARENDFDLVPALIESTEIDDPWDAVEQWAACRTSAEAVARIRMLSLPGHVVLTDAPADAPRRSSVVTSLGGRRTQVRDRPLVVDLTSLWAGPLCAHLLGLGGADIVKVESTRRPDGARRGPAAFYNLLHAGHRSVALDFTDPADVDRLIGLLQRADLVLESSRPRAMTQLGVPVDDLVADGVSWLSITAAGRDSDEVGFGDDVAVGAGLHIEDRGELLPCGDALADPLTGIVAARCAAEALLSQDAMLLDVSMHDVCLEAVADRKVPAATVEQDADGVWWVDTGVARTPVAAPVARRSAGQAAQLGQHTEQVLAP